jgi:hypothetical protein
MLLQMSDIGTLTPPSRPSLPSALRPWQAVVLIDEADVFLKERTIANLQRDAVSGRFSKKA